jgi:hypothetical protein
MKLAFFVGLSAIVAATLLGLVAVLIDKSSE